MSKRMIAAALVITMVAILIAPICAEDSEAIDKDDYKVSMPMYPGTKDFNYVFIGNGHSRTFVIYIQNYTDHVLDVTFFTYCYGKNIDGEKMSNLTLMPAGDESGKDLLKQNYTITVSEIASSREDLLVELHMNITDLTDDSVDTTVIRFMVTVESSFDTSGSYNKFLGIFDNTLQPPFETSVTPFVVTFIIYVAVAALIVAILIPLISKMMGGDLSVGEKRRLKVFLILGASITTLALFLDPGIRILGSDVNAFYHIHRACMAIMVVVLAYVIWKIYMMLVSSILRRLGQLEESRVDMTLLPIFALIGKLFLWVGGIASILHIYGFDLSGILVSAGIVTLGISLGAQSVLSQFFSGISLLLTRPFSKGDYLNIDGQTYIVRRVKLMYTEFMGEEKDRIITMPNNVVASATIVNMTKYDKAYRLYIFFEIPYDIDVKKAEEVMLKMAEESEYVIHDYERYKKPVVKLIDFLDSGIQLRLDVTIKDYASMPSIRSNLKKELYVRLAEAGIEAPYSRLEVTILNPNGESPEV